MLSINHHGFVHEMLENTEECPSQFLRAQGDLNKCRVLSTHIFIFEKLEPRHMCFKNDCKSLQMNFLSTN